MQKVSRTWQRRDINATGLNNIRAPLLLQLRAAGWCASGTSDGRAVLKFSRITRHSLKHQSRPTRRRRTLYVFWSQRLFLIRAYSYHSFFIFRCRLSLNKFCIQLALYLTWCLTTQSFLLDIQLLEKWSEIKPLLWFETVIKICF